MSVSSSAPPSDSTEKLVTFDELPLSSEVRKAVDELGYVHPTPVQRAVFESASRGADLVVQARTGTGKTAAFGLPLVDRLVKPKTPGVQALVLSPTRELALQITRELSALGKYRDLRFSAVYGGAPMQRQIDDIREGAQLVIGTPGRVLDHLSRGTLDPSTIRIVVLDESDEMLSMGFLPQINDILSYLKKPHQTLLFSATVPPDVRRMAETRLKDPQFITLSGDHIGALSIQHFVYLSRGDKGNELVQIIESENPESAIVFCNTRDQTKRVAAALQQQGFAADWLNADLAQSDREKVMAATRDSKLRFLVATDVAARGIDISHLTHVINADFPESTENYVHRTGRTGRAGRTGTAISLITPQDVGNLYMLKLTYKIFPIERDLPTRREQKTRQEADLVSMFAEAFCTKRPHPDDLSLARRLLSHEAAEVIVAGLLRDHLGARPEAQESAAALRRSRLPRSVEEAGPEQPSRSRDGDEAPSQGRDEARGDAKRKKKDKDKRKKKHGDERRSHDTEERHVVRDHDEDRGERAALDGDDEFEQELEPVRFTIEGDEGDEPAAPTTSQPSTSQPSTSQPSTSQPQRVTEPQRAAAPERTDAPKEANGHSPRTVEARAHGANGGRERISSEDASVSEGAPASEDTSGTSDVVRIFVSLGRRHGVRREDINDVLEEQGFDENEVAFVKVRERHTFVGVPVDLEKRAILALDGAQIRGRTAQAEKARAQAQDD